MPSPARVDRLPALSDAPAEALRLIALERRAAATDPPSLREPLLQAWDETAERVRNGNQPGALWVGPADEAIALALWSLPAGAGRRASIIVDAGYRTLAVLAHFVGALDGPEPLRGIWEPIRGFASADVARVLAGRGFVRVVRSDMHFPSSLPVPAVPSAAALPIRPLERSDEAAVAHLLDVAYRDAPVDRILFARTLDGTEDARIAAAELLGTGLGTWVATASFGAWAEEGLVAAALVHDFHGPLISEVMVAPAWRRRGLARHLLARSIEAIRAAGLGEPRLVVTVGNDRAEPLYRSVGFVPDPTTEGAIWLRLPASTVPAPSP